MHMFLFCFVSLWLYYQSLWVSCLYFPISFRVTSTREKIQCGAHKRWSIFSQNLHKRHPTARPFGRIMVCLLWIQSLVYILLHILQWCIQYHATLGRVITARDCNCPGATEVIADVMGKTCDNLTRTKCTELRAACVLCGTYCASLIIAYMLLNTTVPFIILSFLNIKFSRDAHPWPCYLILIKLYDKYCYVNASLCSYLIANPDCLHYYCFRFITIIIHHVGMSIFMGISIKKLWHLTNHQNVFLPIPRCRQ